MICRSGRPGRRAAGPLAGLAGAAFVDIVLGEGGDDGSGEHRGCGKSIDAPPKSRELVQCGCGCLLDLPDGAIPS